MSLINDALKKAQRQRTEDPVGTAPPFAGGGTRVAKRSQPRTSQQLVLLASGVVVLVMLTVVATVWLLNRPTEPKPTPVASGPKTKPSDTPSAPLIVVTPPTTSVTPPTTLPPVIPAPKAPPATAVAPAPTPPPVTPPTPPPVDVAGRSTPAQATKTAPPAPPPVTPPVALSETPAVAAPPSSPENRPATPAPVAAPSRGDERVHVFIDAIRVTGIRSSGEESRVLMNDRVFRVNDIVDRNLGLRLTKVDTNALTFTDGNGVTYTKNF